MYDEAKIHQLHAAADECARDIHAKIQLHLGAHRIDSVSLEKALSLAFERGAVWMQERALLIVGGKSPPANRQPL